MLRLIRRSLTGADIIRSGKPFSLDVEVGESCEMLGPMFVFVDSTASGL